MTNSTLKPMVLPAMVLIALFIFVCPLNAKESTAPKNEKAAVVNGTVIPMDDFERLYGLQMKQLPAKADSLPPGYLKQLRAKLIENMVNKELLSQAGKKQKITVDKGSVDEKIAVFQKRFPGPEQFQSWLKQMQLTEEEFRSQMADDMLIQALIEKEIISKIKVKDEEVKAYFDSNLDKFRVEESVRASHILIKVDPSADETTKDKARKELKEIKKKILAGEDFATLAKEHSQCPSSSRGGDLGYFKRGQMVKPFDEMAFKMSVNEISDIVETRFGYHLIKVLDHKSAEEPKFEKVKPKVMNIVREERFQKKITDYIANLRKQAKIETFVE